MRTISTFQYWLAGFLTVAWISAMNSGAEAALAPRGAGTEEYFYIAAPNNKTGEQERISMQFSENDDTLRCVTRTETADNLETDVIEMKNNGEFLSAIRYTNPHDGDRVTTNRIWRAGEKIIFGRGSADWKRDVQCDIPKVTPVAVDASLLVLMRHFPFDRQTTQTVFMADFSGRTVTVLVHEAGVENVSVPAGDFRCHRMEVVVDVFLIKPRIIYWISVAEPHFLVRHRGKRGPFTPAYTTSLARIGNSGDSR